MQIRLTRLALSWSRGDKKGSSPPLALDSPSPIASDSGAIGGKTALVDVATDDDEGLIDLVEDGVAGFKEVTGVTSRMKEEIERLGRDISEGGVALGQAKDPSGQVSLAKVKVVLSRVAESMDRFASELMGQVRPFREAYGRALRAYGKSAMLLSDFSGGVRDQLPAAIEMITGLEAAMAGGQDSLAQLRTAIQNQPRTVSQFNKAKRRALDALGEIDREMSAARTSAGETKRLFQELLARQDAGNPSS